MLARKRSPARVQYEACDRVDSKQKRQIIRVDCCIIAGWTGLGRWSRRYLCEAYLSSGVVNVNCGHVPEVDPAKQERNILSVGYCDRDAVVSVCADYNVETVNIGG